VNVAHQVLFALVIGGGSLSACGGGSEYACTELEAYKRARAREPQEGPRGSIDVNAARATDADAGVDAGAAAAGAAIDVDQTARDCESASDRQACNDTGTAYAFGRGVRANRAIARRWLDRACRLGSPAGCGNLAALMIANPEIEEDEARCAERLLDRSCEDGFVDGCVTLGLVYANGLEGVERDPMFAAVLIERSCDRGSARGCGELALMYDDGRAVPHDAVRARELYERACRGGYEEACAHVQQ